MRGDFSRRTFDPKKHYSSVLIQQGRVQVDADWNEQQAIHQRRIETEARDVIGQCGAPVHDAGFEIMVKDNKALSISKGRYYVDGILCENESDIAYHQQPDLPDPPDVQKLLTVESPLGLVYLDVWQRHLTALDDPRIREVALNGPDTATRSQTVWQVKILPVNATDPRTVNCDSQFTEWNALTAPSTGMLNARTQPLASVDDLCLIPPTAGYRRLENQLYRVEIHENSDMPGGPTFKWSRDNGSVVTAIEQVSGQEVTVRDIGPDEVLGFANGQWVEVIDDALELNGKPGQLIQIDNVHPPTRVVTLKSVPNLVFDPTRHPKLRRWDSAGEIKVEVPVSNDGWIPLEGDIEVRFSAGEYRTGDYWLIPARTATGEIEWPPYQIPNTNPTPQPPLGIEHHYCRLALLSFSQEELKVDEDCRHRFPPLTELPSDATIEAGIHVTGVNLLAGEQLRSLHNDTEVRVAELARGIHVVCDTEVDQDTVRGKPTCFVTLDMPFPFNNLDRDLWGAPVIGFQPLILAADVNADNQEIFWAPTMDTIDWLQQRLFQMMKEFRRGDRVLAHLTLKGNFIWDQKNPENPILYLDGETFGFRRPGATNTDLRFPSGNGRRGGDFEMWFWLVQ